MSLKRLLAQAAWVLGVTSWSGAAFAQEVIGEPKPDQIGLQPPVTALADELDWIHNVILTPLIFVIAIFVMILLLYVIYRFSAKRNPVPSKVTHNTLLEVAWTGIPVLILVIIAIPSFRLLYNQLEIPKPDMTIKAVGHQWYWSYVYPDNGNFTFDATIVPENEIKAGQHRLLETDNIVVVPVDTNIRLLVTAADVIHAWAMPAFGVKKDAVPGRTNETWFRAEREGTYYGQCSEICGAYHGYMPIKVQVVSKDAYAKWAEEAKQKFASVDGPSPRLADARVAQ